MADSWFKTDAEAQRRTKRRLAKSMYDVENILDILCGAIDSGALGLGQANIQELRADDLVIPAGFALTLGGVGRAAR